MKARRRRGGKRERFHPELTSLLSHVRARQTGSRSLGATVRQLLVCYLQIMYEEAHILHSCRALTRGEWAALRELGCYHDLLDFGTTQVLPEIVEAECQLGTFVQRYGLDANAFVQRLHDLGPTQRLALADDLALFRHRHEQRSDHSVTSR